MADQCQGPFASISPQTMGEYGAGHPQPLHTSHSFSRLESAPSSPLGQSRASTLQNVNTQSNMGPDMKDPQQGGKIKTISGDIFDKTADGSSVATTTETTMAISPQILPEGFDELPIELISLTDRYGNLYFLN